MDGYKGRITETSDSLLAASKLLGIYCNDENDLFLYCKSVNPNPYYCKDQAIAVTTCAIKAFEEIHMKCKDSFNDYSYCLEQKNHDLHRCRKPETKFRDCANEHILANSQHKIQPFKFVGKSKKGRQQ